MIQGVLFDMDGLMFDTERIGYEGWKYAGARLGIDISDDLIASFRGTGAKEKRKLFEKAAGSGADYEEAFALRTAYADEWIRQNGLPVKPGLENLLRYLKESGIKAALATSSPREKAMEYLCLAGVKGYFSAAVCGPEAGRAKPAPDIFLMASEALELQPQECLVLEDSRNGLSAAKAAGCRAVVIPDMEPAPDKEEHLWDAEAANLGEVVSLLEQMKENI